MKTKRIKTPVREITQDEADALVGEIASLVNREREIKTGIDEAVLAIREQYREELAMLEQAIKQRSALVQAWAVTTDFGKRKSMELTHGTVGFRLGNPKLKTLSGWTFDRVLSKLREIPWGRAFIRIKEEVDKEKLIADTSAEILTAGELKEIGCRIAQDESFFIEPNLSETPARLGNA